MDECIKVRGMVLSAMPIGEQDKRLVLETCELGRITAFARGCRRAGSPMLAAANPFVMGTFQLIPGRNSWRISEISVQEYFRELAAKQPEVYLGFYFLDLVDYYGQENIDGTDTLNLLYVSLKALLREGADLSLIRSVFELRLLAMNGDYAPQENEADSAVLSVCQYILRTPLSKLYGFRLKPEAAEALKKTAQRAVGRTVDRELKSRKILELFL